MSSRSTASKAAKSARRRASTTPVSSEDSVAEAKRALAEASAALSKVLSSAVDDALTQAQAGAGESVVRGLRATAKALEQASAKLSPRKVSTRDQILDAAATVFAAKGFDGASVADIVEAAGFTKGALYSQFPSKEAVFLEVVRRRTFGCTEDGTPTTRTVNSDLTEGDLAEITMTDLLLGPEAMTFGFRHPEHREQIATLFDDAVRQVAIDAFGSDTSAHRERAVAILAVSNLMAMFHALGLKDATPSALNDAVTAIREAGRAQDR